MDYQDLSLRHYTLDVDTDSILWVTMDVAEKTENVLDVAVLSELKMILDKVKKDTTIRGLGLLSAKRNFIMGADVNAFADLTNQSQIAELLDQAHEVLDTLATLNIPTGCGINGFCLGGGLEVALACQYRVILNDEMHKYKSSIGFPEIKLGIYPGFGGTFRSIAQLGPVTALSMMLSGRNYKPSACRKMGIAHALANSHGQLRWIIRKAILRGTILQPRASFLQRLPNALPLRLMVYNKMKKEVAKKANPTHYPAPYRLLAIWRQAGGDATKMQALEKSNFADLMVSPTARNLQRIYYISNAMKGLAKAVPEAHKITHVHVIGAGTMGLDIAMHCVLKGYTVTVQDVNQDMLNKAMGKAKSFFKKRLKNPLLVNRALSRLHMDKDGIGISTADVAIEAIVEKLDIKAKVFQKLEQDAPPHAILATNTSAIPLEKIADKMQDKSRLIGLHFFNPAHTLPLVEVIQSDVADDKWVSMGAKFAKDIGKFPLVVKSSPGFLVNRVLAPYIMRAIELEQNGTYDKETLDAACRAFGMPMGPIELADTVGLDIMKNVAEGLSIPLTNATKMMALIDGGTLGRKTGQGYYTWNKGRAVKNKTITPPSDTASIAHEVLSPLWQEAQICLDEGIVLGENKKHSADLIDGGIIFGTGFAPHLGGALHYVATLNTNERK